MMSVRSEKAYKFCLWKAYFDKGIGLTNYAKYLIAFFGLASANVKNTMIIAIAYALFCFFLGRWWFKSKMVEQEIEVGNRVNPFVRLTENYIKNNTL